jgi:hypothetical protein
VSTDDVYELFSGPCSCGKGKFRLIESSPDHPWAQPHQTQHTISNTCPDCRAKYVLQYENGRLVRFYKKDWNAKKQKGEDWHRKLREIEGYLMTKGHYQSLADWLNTFPSATAVHKELKFTGSLSGFQRQFKRRQCTADWVKRHFDSQRIVPALLKTKLNIKDPRLEALLKEAKQIWRKYQEPLTHIKPPLYTRPV